MKHGTAINCIEFTGGNIYNVPPTADPNEANLNLEVKVYKLNPDGSKGELIRTDPAYPEGWDTPKFNSNIKEEEKMAKKMLMPADFIEVYNKNKAQLNPVAKHYGVSWYKVRDWAIEAGLPWEQKPKLEKKEPKKNYFGTPIIEPKADKPVQGCPFDEPVFNPDMPVDKPEQVPADYKNMNCMKRIDEYAMNNELAKLKIDFANLTLLSTLNDTMKLKVIEYIVRM